jgi:hypothetical protein
MESYGIHRISRNHTESPESHGIIWNPRNLMESSESCGINRITKKCVESMESTESWNHGISCFPLAHMRACCRVLHEFIGRG